jgi:hypothetical protein
MDRGFVAMSEPHKWELNPQACLRELGRMDEDPGYMKTICGVHRILWSKLNVDFAGYLPEDAIEEINNLLEIAFKYGKRMDYRLKQYHSEGAGLSLTEQQIFDYRPGDDISEKFQRPVEFSPKDPKGKKSCRKR